MKRAHLIHLLTAQPHIAHPAVHIAQRKQLDAAIDGTILLRRTRHQHLLQRKLIRFHNTHLDQKKDGNIPPCIISDFYESANYERLGWPSAVANTVPL